MTRLPGLGPKRARRLFDELGIESPEMLRAAAEEQRLRGLKGFGPKFEASVLASLDSGAGERPAQRVLLNRALEVGEQIVAALRAPPAAERVELAGSARRQTDSVKDLDIIATATDPGALARALGELDLVESASAPNDNAARGRTHTGLPVDLRVVEPANFGNLLQHFTGSQAHNVALREAAVRRGLHVSEYGILDDATGETLRCATEEEVYARLGLAWIPPELREGRGEIEAATAGGPGPRARSRVPRDHGPLRVARLRQPRERGGARGAHRGDPRAQRAHGGHRGLDRDGDEHPPGRLAGLPRRAARPPGLGDRV